MPNSFRMLFLAAACGLYGCQGASLQDLSLVQSFAPAETGSALVNGAANDSLIETGKAQFAAGNYVKSYALFEKSAKVFPDDPSAWLGLAASADRIGRFDAADKAYGRLAAMIPERAEFHNNVGYSHLLRGDLKGARRHFMKAREIDPGNATVANNLQLMRTGMSNSAGS